MTKQTLIERYKYEKVVITGNCNGLTYYLQFTVNRRGYAPEFIWNGLINNATNFRTVEAAKKIMGEIYPYIKIDMEVKEIKKGRTKNAPSH